MPPTSCGPGRHDKLVHLSASSSPASPRHSDHGIALGSYCLNQYQANFVPDVPPPTRSASITVTETPACARPVGHARSDDTSSDDDSSSRPSQILSLNVAAGRGR